MKKTIIVIFCSFALLMSACIVKSLHPFYHEKDVVYSKLLQGKWLDQDSAKWTFKQASYSTAFMKPEKKDNSYEVLMTEQGDTSYFSVHLFKLNSEYYLDFTPLIEPNIGDNWASFHFIPSHSVARLVFTGEKNVSFYWYDEEWLGRLFEQKKIKISHENISGMGKKEEYILTAETDELQKFIVKYGSEIEVFSRINMDSIAQLNESVDIQNSIVEKINGLSGIDELSDIIFVSMRKEE